MLENNGTWFEDKEAVSEWRLLKTRELTVIASLIKKFKAKTTI